MAFNTARDQNIFVFKDKVFREALCSHVGVFVPFKQAYNTKMERVAPTPFIFSEPGLIIYVRDQKPFLNFLPKFRDQQCRKTDFREVKPSLQRIRLSIPVRSDSFVASSCPLSVTCQSKLQVMASLFICQSLSNHKGLFQVFSAFYICHRVESQLLKSLRFFGPSMPGCKSGW